MAQHVNRGKARPHERQRCHKRAKRKSRQATDAVAACTTGAVARANADQQAGCYQRGPFGIDPRAGNYGKHRVNQRCADQSQKKGHPPSDVVGLDPQQSAQNTADACDSAIEQNKDGRRQTDECPACQCSEGG